MAKMKKPMKKASMMKKSAPKRVASKRPSAPPMQASPMQPAMGGPSPMSAGPMGGGSMMKRGGKMKMKKAKLGTTTTSETTKKPSPTYKNLPMGVRNEQYQITGQNRNVTPSSKDSARYRGGFEQGLKGMKGLPNEGQVEKMGRWEGQNANKAKKGKTGLKVSVKKSAKATMSKMKKGGKMSKGKKC